MMDISMEIEVDSWLKAMEYLMENISYAKKGHNGYYFERVVLKDIELKEDPFSSCCYTNQQGKLSSLRKQYLNQESLNSLFSADRVEVSMIGGPKWGSAAKNQHCMESLLVDHQNKRVTINFRNSDFFKKFLVDLYFVKTILSEAGVNGYSYSCHFENLTLRTPFVYLLLNQVYKAEGEAAVRKYLESDNPLIQAFIAYYSSPSTKSITYKSLERAQRRMKELSVYNNIIKEYIT